MPRDPVTGQKVTDEQYERTQKFFALRRSGYRGPIDQDGDPSRVSGKGSRARIVKGKRFVPGRGRR